MDDLLLRIVGCLLQVLRDHGASAYHRAGRRALKAVCAVLMEEVERTTKARRASGNVIRFPINGRDGTGPDD